MLLDGASRVFRGKVLNGFSFLVHFTKLWLGL